MSLTRLCDAAPDSCVVTVVGIVKYVWGEIGLKDLSQMIPVPQLGKMDGGGLGGNSGCCVGQWRMSVCGWFAKSPNPRSRCTVHRMRLDDTGRLRSTASGDRWKHATAPAPGTSPVWGLMILPENGLPPSSWPFPVKLVHAPGTPVVALAVHRHAVRTKLVANFFSCSPVLQEDFHPESCPRCCSLSATMRLLMQSCP